MSIKETLIKKLQDKTARIAILGLDYVGARALPDFSALRECNEVSICVPTPLSRTHDPDLSNLGKLFIRCLLFDCLRDKSE